MTTKSPSNQGGSNSGISDVKYQKAIKQISKLISLNTTLKNDAIKVQEKYDKLQAQYDLLEAKYNNLKCESKTNNETVMEILPDPKLSQKISSTVFQDDSADFTQLIEKNKKITQLEEKLKEKQEKLSKLKREIEEKTNQIQDEKRKNANLHQQLNSFQSSKNLQNIEVSERQFVKLKKELENSEQWVRKISIDYENLKKQLIFSPKTSTNANSIEINTHFQSGQDSLTQFYLQKLKKSEALNLKIKKQFNYKKEKLKSEVERLKLQNEGHIKKMINLTNLLERQQLFIEKFIMKEKTQSVDSC